MTGNRHADVEYTAAPRPGAHLQAMPKYPAESVGNRQAQPQAFFGPSLVAVEAFELFENHLALVLGNPRPAVPDFQGQQATLAPHPEQDRALGVAEGIGQEVLQDSA